MIKVSTFAGKRVALCGLGGSGLATARALVEGGALVEACDDNPASIAAAEAAGIATRDLRGGDWSDYAALVLAPGVPLTHPAPHWSVQLAKAAGVEVIGDIELFGRERRALAPTAPFIAITGTNGKSTTTALIAHCLTSAGRDTQLGGNIGTAVLTLEPPAPGRFHVVECSSYQIDLSPTLAPSVGILLNLSPDHLDRHGSMEHYAAVKARLAAGADVAVIGVDDIFCARIADEAEASGRRVIRLSHGPSLRDGYVFDAGFVLRVENGLAVTRFDLAGIGSLRGRHNGQNAAAAIAALSTSGLADDEIVRGLKSFPGLAHRMQEVGRIGRVLFVNDSKATNADAAAPALSTFEKIHWIAGGLAKEGGIASLAPYFPRIAKAYLIGEAAPAFAATLGGETLDADHRGERIPYEISGTLELAVEHAARDAAASGEAAVVLLSPACASFDQFRNFEVRGQAFAEAVGRLAGAPTVTKV